MEPGLRHARSSESAIDKQSTSAARPHSQSPLADAQLPETHSTSTSTPTSFLTMCSVRRGPGCVRQKLRYGSHGAHGSEAWGPAIDTRKRSPTSTVGPSSLRNLWHQPIAADTATWDTPMDDVLQDRRQPGHQDAAVSQPNPHQPSATAQPIPQGDTVVDSPLPSRPSSGDRYHRTRQAAARRSPPSLSDGPSTHGLPIRHCLEGAIHGHQSWAVLCRYRYRLVLAEVPQGSDRNTEVKQRLQLWETAKFMVSLEEFRENSIQDLQAEERKLGSR